MDTTDNNNSNNNEENMVANGLFDVAAAIREHTQYLRSLDEACDG